MPQKMFQDMCPRHTHIQAIPLTFHSFMREKHLKVYFILHAYSCVRHYMSQMQFIGSAGPRVVKAMLICSQTTGIKYCLVLSSNADYSYLEQYSGILAGLHRRALSRSRVKVFFLDLNQDENQITRRRQFINGYFKIDQELGNSLAMFLL